MKIQIFTDSFLIYSQESIPWAILVDPFNRWEEIQTFLGKNKIQLRYILLTEATFEKALRVAQIKQETGAKFLSFQPDLLRLRKLPTLANQANVCGIKIPHVDRFLDDLHEIIIDGIKLQIRTSGRMHGYVIGEHSIPVVKVETPYKIE